MAAMPSHGARLLWDEPEYRFLVAISESELMCLMQGSMQA